MKVKRMISVICAAAMSISAFAGLSVQAAESVTWETILEDNFDNGISKVTDEGAVTGSQIENVDNTLKFGNSYETFHISFDDKKSYSSSEANIFKITFDTKVESLNRLGIGLGDTVRNNGAYWNFSAIVAGTTSSAQGKLAMGSAWEDAKLYALADSDGNTKDAEGETWYTVEAYLEMPSKKMITKAWAKDDPSNVYTKTITAPVYGSYNVGGSQGTSVNAVRLFSRGISYLDNLKVERMVFPSDGGLLYWADFDAVGSTPADEVSGTAVTKSIAYDGTNRYLTLNSSWGSTYYKLSETISQSSACNIETSFDIKFSASSRNGVGIGGNNRDSGSFWIIAYTNQGLQIGSVDNSEKGRRVLLKDSEGNKLTPDTAKWYRVESKIELPSKKMETKLYARDEENPTVYSATGDMFAKGNYIVGGMDPGVDITKLRLFTGSTPMSVDNIVVEKTVPPFNVVSAEFNGTGIDVTFNYEISDGSSIMLNGQTTQGTLSADKMTYTIPASDLKTGTYTVTIAEGFAADNGLTTAEEMSFLVEVKDSLTLGYHPFNNGKDNGASLGLGGIGSNWASIEMDDDGNYYMHATKGTAAATGDPGNYRYWQYLTDNKAALDDYWNETAASKLLEIEFDIRTNAVPTGLERIYFSQIHKYQNGLQIFGMNADCIAMGEPEPVRAFTEISQLTPGNWYHYTYILDINNKRAKAILSDGTNEYKMDWKELSGSAQGYWNSNLSTPFDTLAFQLPGGDIDLDNITFKKYYEAPTVNSESITLLSDDEIQSDWSKVSASANKAVIDFATTMNEDTVNSNTVYVTKKGDAQKLDTTGSFVSGKYVLTINEALTQNTEYELHITTGVQNPAGETFGTEEYTAVFVTKAGEIKASLTGVKTNDGTEINDFASFVSMSGQKLKINVHYTNTTQTVGEYNIIVAHFGSEALLSAEIINVSKDASVNASDDEVEYTVPSDMSNITNTSIFLWDTLTDIKPLSNPIIY